MGKYCTNCGSELHTGARFCAKCGAAVLDAPENPVPAAQTPAPRAQTATEAQPQKLNPSAAPKRSGGRTALCIVLSVLLVIQIAAVALFGWPGFMVGCTKENSAGSQTGSKPGSQPGGRPAEPEMAQLSPAEAMQAGMVRLMERLSDEGVSGGMNLNAAFGIPGDLYSYNSAELSVTIEGEDSSLVYCQRSVLGKNGDAEHSMSMDSDGESIKAGTYFKGNDMILQMGDAALPLIRYQMTSEDAAAISGMAAMERYLRILRTDNPAQGVITDWSAALAAVGSLLADNEGEIVSGTEAVVAGENSFEAEVYSLALSGDEAVQAFSAFIDGWRQDFRCGDMLSISDVFIEDETLPALERMAAMAAGNQDAALTLRTGVYENMPVLFELTYAGAAGECRLAILFLEQEENGYSSVRLRFPEGDGFFYEDKSAAGVSSTAHNFYGAGDTLLSESLLGSTGSGDKSSYSSSFSYVMIDYTDEDVPQGKKMESSGSYSHSISGKLISGSFSGEMLISGDEDGEPMAFSGTVKLSEDFGEPAIPEFIEGSGRNASTRLELFTALYADNEDAEPEAVMKRLETIPALYRPITGNLILFGL
jgi:hypothetical protein